MLSTKWFFTLNKSPVHFFLIQNEPPEGIPAGKKSRLRKHCCDHRISATFCQWSAMLNI